MVEKTDLRTISVTERGTARALRLLYKTETGIPLDERLQQKFDSITERISRMPMPENNDIETHRVQKEKLRLQMALKFAKATDNFEMSAKAMTLIEKYLATKPGTPERSEAGASVDEFSLYMEIWSLEARVDELVANVGRRMIGMPRRKGDDMEVANLQKVIEFLRQTNLVNNLNTYQDCISLAEKYLDARDWIERKDIMAKIIKKSGDIKDAMHADILAEIEKSPTKGEE